MTALRTGALLLLLPVACATAPRPTEASLRRLANPRAVVEGRVTDSDGRPVAGIAVRGVPRGEDVPWAPWVVTRCDGTFRLAVAAPARYGFQLRWDRRSVLTESPRDPARLDIQLVPGERRGGIELVLLDAPWRSVTGSAWVPPGPIPCP